MMGKAFRFHQHGGPEVMQWEDIDVPPPTAGQVRMRHTAVAVNYRDVLIRRGIHEVRTFPSGIGLESAGVVEAVGPDVTDVAIGDRIACVAGPDGAYAEARNVPAARAVKLPDDIDDRTAASMMVRGMTARYLLHDTYAVKPGDTILVHAAAGGVGLILCQWAKHLGATVIGTVSTDEKAAVVRAHGCDHAIVYTREDFPARVKDITGGEGVAVAYDSVGRTTLEGSARSLRPRGVLVSYGEASGDPEPVPPRRLGDWGSIFLTHPRLPDYTATRADLLRAANDLFAMVQSGKVKIEISHSYALRDAPQAHADLEARKTTGSIVLIP
jgi:NADPH2:quinone reductase